MLKTFQVKGDFQFRLTEKDGQYHAEIVQWNGSVRAKGSAPAEEAAWGLAVIELEKGLRSAGLNYQVTRT